MYLFIFRWCLLLLKRLIKRNRSNSTNQSTKVQRLSFHTDYQKSPNLYSLVIHKLGERHKKSPSCLHHNNMQIRAGIRGPLAKTVMFVNLSWQTILRIFHNQTNCWWRICRQPSLYQVECVWNAFIDSYCVEVQEVDDVDRYINVKNGELYSIGNTPTNLPARPVTWWWGGYWDLHIL